MRIMTTAILFAALALAPSWATATEIFRVGTAEVEVGETVLLTANLETESRPELYSAFVELEFDASVVEIVDVEPTDDVRNAWSGVVWNVVENRLLVAMAGANSVSNPGSLFVFTVRGVIEGEANLVVRRALLDDLVVEKTEDGWVKVVEGVSNGVGSWGAVKAAYVTQ